MATKQTDELRAAILDLEGDESNAETVAQLTELYKQSHDSDEPVEISEELSELVSKVTSKRQATQLREKALGKLRDACKQASGIDGSHEYFEGRLIDVDGTPMLADRDGNPKPINAATVAELLPNSLKTGKRAHQADELEDLRESIAEVERDVAALKSQYARSGGDTVVQMQASQAMKKLRTLKARRDAIKAERAADRRGPGALPNVATPAVVAKFENFRTTVKRLEAQFHNSGGRDNHAMAKARGMRKQMRAMQQEYASLS